MKKLWDVVWYNGGKGPADGNNYWRRFTAAHYVYIGVMLCLMSVGTGLVCLCIGSVYPGSDGRSIFLSYFEEPLILFLNILPVLLLTAFLYFASGRAWVSFLCGFLIPVGLSIVQFYKIAIRGDMFIFSDFTLIGEMTGIISNYTLEISGRTILAISTFVFGLVFASLLMRGTLKNVWVRVMGSVLSLAALVTLLFTVYFSDSVYDGVKNRTASFNIWVEQQVYASKGFLYSFLHSAPDVISTPPEGYSKNAAADLLGSFTEGKIDEEKRVNVVAIMFEAYADLSRFEGLDIHEDVYAPLEKLRSESLYGNLISNVSGGGTIDTERCFLTGYTELGDYLRATESYVYFLRRNGYYAEGLHPGDGWYYHRESVERSLGMENYYFLDDYVNSNRSDAFFFEALRGLIDSRDPARPYFNFSVTYQNHGGYSDASTVKEMYLERGALSQGSFNILNNYLSGVADTSARMLAFVDSLRDDPEPFVVVFFGDHMPFLKSALSETGVNLDLSTNQGFANYYTTPYIIWANDAAKRATGGSFTGQGPDLSACFLMDRVFDECGWGKSAYMQLSHTVAQRVQVIHTGIQAWYLDGALVHELPEDAQELCDELKYVEYYLKNDYSGKLIPGV